MVKAQLTVIGHWSLVIGHWSLVYGGAGEYTKRGGLFSENSKYS